MLKAFARPIQKAAPNEAELNSLFVYQVCQRYDSNDVHWRPPLAKRLEGQTVA